MPSADLEKKLQKSSDDLMAVLDKVPPHSSRTREVAFTGGDVSVCDVVAYQIGWGKLLVGWYRTGAAGKTPEMPLNGFTWDYAALAEHFYKQHQKKSLKALKSEFVSVAEEILEIVRAEQKTGNLDKIGVWPWCRLQSGREWPLSKWIQVNSVSPYKRATTAIRKFIRTL